MKILLSIAFLVALSSLTLHAAEKDQDGLMNDKLFASMKLRNIGPAYMSGRIADIEVDSENPSTWYVAVGSGGVWKTDNGGITFKPIFDSEAVYSTGDVTIDPSNSNIIWVGTGENNGGRHLSFGDGVYRSLDAGKTWKNMGLKESEHISDIIIHPTDSNTVWVSSQGPLWSKGGQRGLFKTTNGGQTWENVLKIDEWTGVTSLVIDSSNPDKLYAATWQRQRTLPAFVGTGKGSAIHTTDDGGKTWRKLSEGLPTTDIGKIGLAISAINPDVVYAGIELNQRKGGFYRSADQGASWTKMSDAVAGGTGPHYYQEIFADPHRFDRVYMASNYTQYSDNGGKTWTPMNVKNKHVDDHAIAFHPTNKDFLLVGSDGGIYETQDGMDKWRFLANMPITQFYKIAVDDSKPFYYVYGGTQDNSSQGGPSRTTKTHGIKNNDWFLILDWDGHQPATEPGNPDVVYGQRQQGNLARFHRKTGEYVSIQPQEKPGEPAERYNWDAPILVSSHNPQRLYHASQRVWRSDDRGNSWQAISGDLTKNQNRMHMPVMDRTWSVNSGLDLLAMSNFNTIANIAESPLDENILYAGTDDGLIQVTSDGGKKWTTYEIDDIRGIPSTAYINDIRADLFDKDTVYAALDNHKFGDYKPYLIKSTNRGKSWKSIASNLPDKHLVWRIVQDHVNKDLLFIGTEFGLFFTVDGGNQWIELTGDVPTISFRDVQIQRRENDLVAGSFGRGIYILDDYSPLRTISKKSLQKEALLFTSRDALWYIPESLHTDSHGDFEYRAENPEFGATFTYYLRDGIKSLKELREEKEEQAQEKDKFPLYPAWETVEIELRESEPSVYVIIKDAKGKIVRKVHAEAKKGLHRVTWDLRMPSANALGTGPSFFGDVGPLVAPGTYTAFLYTTANGTTRELAESVNFNVKPLFDETVPGGVSPQQRTASLLEVESLRRKVSMARGQVDDLKSKLGSFRIALDRSFAPTTELETSYEELRQAVFAAQEALNGKTASSGMGATPATISSRLFMIELARANTWGLTATQKEQMLIVQDALNVLLPRLNNLREQTFPAFKQSLLDAGAPWMPEGLMKEMSDEPVEID
ncbi:FlgD immunoglobulin-like domain containing protein [Thalassotalea psychrophila]|uniref:FlgD immunoglobulin-like domain containing protein n=1 Tax=Thalassotalea psychrophila TaxID=3065647 RepID=A0ABY9TXU5_9GAMM|nr:FlgD immunoglobulin-like domain containing protein [Colwelliaceae bacterium SQ149]